MITPALLGAVAIVGGGSGQYNGVVGWTDFSEQEDWANPPEDWTGRWAMKDTSSGVELRTQILKARSLSGRMLMIDNESDGFSASFRGTYTWDIPGIMPAADIEILVLIRGWANGATGVGIAEGLAPSGGLYTPDLMQMINFSAINTNPRLRDTQKNRTANSWGSSTFTDAGAGALIPSFNRFFCRFRRTSTKRWRAKVWDAALAEPAGWQHDVSSDALLDNASGGYGGPAFLNWIGTTTSPQFFEYLSVSTNPGTIPAPMPTSLALTGGHFGTVDMTTAAMAAGTGFFNYPLNGTVLTPVIEARVGSKHGVTMRITAAAAGPRGMVGWNPGGYLLNGDVLALLDVGAVQNTVLGAGVIYPKTPSPTYYVKAHRSFACLRDFANAVAWMGVKDKNDATDFPLRTNVTGVTINNNEKWWVRHRRENQHNIKCRFWKDGTAEPSTWSVDQTSQYQHDPVGMPGIAYEFGAAAGSLYLEHLAWTDDPTANPVNPV